MTSRKQSLLLPALLLLAGLVAVTVMPSAEELNKDGAATETAVGKSLEVASDPEMLASLSVAGPATTDKDLASAQAEIEAGDDAGLRARLAKLFPSTPADKAQVTPVPGLYEVTIGPKVVYMSADGRYLVRGEIVDLDTEENLTEPAQNAAQLEAVNKVSEDQMLIFGDKDLKHTMTVFTDIDCGYCRKLHSEMQAYNDAGIRVRYLFFPRAGLNSESYDKAVSVWCNADRAAALTEAKQGGEIEKATCENPVQDHMMLGQLLGVRGTPALVLEDGELLPGYIPAQKLAAFLDAQ